MVTNQKKNPISKNSIPFSKSWTQLSDETTTSVTRVTGAQNKKSEEQKTVLWRNKAWNFSKSEGGKNKQKNAAAQRYKNLSKLQAEEL